MMIKPIRTERDHASALARIETLVSAKPGTPELDMLATLVEAYEKAQHPIDPPSPIEAIRFRMEQGQFARAELSELLGGSAKTAEVLASKRALSKAMIVRLHRTLHIPYESLLGDSARIRKPMKRRVVGHKLSRTRAAG
jgi:HTH-type transcriptional regulator/antitoxin HigA